MPKPVFMKLGMYIMAPEPISTAYFINPSHQSVSVCVYLLSLLGKGSVKCIPPFVARQRLGKNVTAATNTHNRRIVGRIVLYAVRVVLNESGRLILPRTSCICFYSLLFLRVYSTIFKIKFGDLFFNVLIWNNIKFRQNARLKFSEV
jgi:hypothetical protein